MLGHRHSSLWHMIAAPTVWALHFCVTYGWTATICARGGDATTARLGIAVATVVALAAILVFGWRSWKQWGVMQDHDRVHDGPSNEARRDFLGHTGWLLSVVAAIGVVFVSMPALFIGSCL